MPDSFYHDGNQGSGPAPVQIHQIGGGGNPQPAGHDPGWQRNPYYSDSPGGKGGGGSTGGGGYGGRDNYRLDWGHSQSPYGGGYGSQGGKAGGYPGMGGGQFSHWGDNSYTDGGSSNRLPEGRDGQVRISGSMPADRYTGEHEFDSPPQVDNKNPNWY